MSSNSREPSDRRAHHPRDVAATSPHRAHAPGRSALAVDYLEHHATVFAAARRVCGPHHAADVTQEVFLTLWREPSRFDPARGSLGSFLSALAHNKAVDVVRSESARRARELRRSASVEPTHVALDDRLLRDDAAAAVREAVSRLPVGEREAITMAFLGGRTYRETAVLLGEPEGTTKSRIRAGLQRLRRDLAEQHAGAEAEPPGRPDPLPVRATAPGVPFSPCRSWWCRAP